MRPSDRDIQAALDAYDIEHGYNAKLPDGAYRIDGHVYKADDAWKLAEMNLMLGLPIRATVTIDFAYEVIMRLDRLDSRLTELETAGE